eukprot:GDKJ01041406.1.p1 GENE.GDKJ01041406.1~~GDKJ01041406.1.p1  ORF type:complete len:207 (+),score=18.72 GDKJ01041406.1:51-671(+)
MSCALVYNIPSYVSLYHLSFVCQLYGDVIFCNFFEARHSFFREAIVMFHEECVLNAFLEFPPFFGEIPTLCVRVNNEEFHFTSLKPIPIEPTEYKYVTDKYMVSNIPHNLKLEELSVYFSQFGKVRDSVIITDKSGVRKGFGFVTFDWHKPIDYESLHSSEHVLKGRCLKVIASAPEGISSKYEKTPVQHLMSTSTTAESEKVPDE